MKKKHFDGSEVPKDYVLNRLHNADINLRRVKKSCFVNEGGKIYFRDAWGEHWGASLLDELIKALRKQRQVRETIEYYEDLAVKHE